MIPSADRDLDSGGRRALGRRSFLKGLGMAGATLLPASALLVNKARAAGDDSGGKLSRGDASILRVLAAAEIIESDLWEQYWELTSGFVRHKGDVFYRVRKGDPSLVSAPGLDDASINRDP